MISKAVGPYDDVSEFAVAGYSSGYFKGRKQLECHAISGQACAVIVRDDVPLLELWVHGTKLIFLVFQIVRCPAVLF